MPRGPSNVPENTHWDPAFKSVEIDFFARFNGEERLEDPVFAIIPETDPGLAGAETAMPDHADVGEGNALSMGPRPQASG